jgi:hypothetical protein
LPFPRDPDYIHRGPLVSKVNEKLSASAARVGLVRLGGIG